MSERIICYDGGGELREEIVRCRDCVYATITVRGDRCKYCEMFLKLVKGHLKKLAGLGG